MSDKLGSYFGIGWVNAILGKVKLARKAAAQLVQIPKLATIPDIGMNIRTSIDDLNDDYEYTRNETYTIYIPVEVDGRQVAKATAKYTKEEIEQQQKRDLRQRDRKSRYCLPRLLILMVNSWKKKYRVTEHYMYQAEKYYLPTL